METAGGRSAQGFTWTGRLERIRLLREKGRNENGRIAHSL